MSHFATRHLIWDIKEDLKHLLSTSHLYLIFKKEVVIMLIATGLKDLL